MTATAPEAGSSTFDALAVLAGAPLNVDPDLVAVLHRNRQIQRRHEPRHTFDAFGSDPLSFLDIVVDCRLEALSRHRESFHLYDNEFRNLVTRKYGSTEAYLRQRLGWQKTSDTLTREKEDEYFVAHGQEGRDHRVALNEWPYAIEPDVAHICVWSRKPLLHKALASSSKEWNRVARQGLAGFIGLSQDLARSLPPDSGVPTSAAEAEGTCAQEIARFVEDRWKPDRWMSVYFGNPPMLQSVRGLSHFHVLVKRHRPADIA